MPFALLTLAVHGSPEVQKAVERVMTLLLPLTHYGSLPGSLQAVSKEVEKESQWKLGAKLATSGMEQIPFVAAALRLPADEGGLGE